MRTYLPYFLSSLMFMGVLSGCARQEIRESRDNVPATISVEAASLGLRQQVEGSLADHPLTAFGISLKAKEILQEFYIERNFQPAWFDDNLRPTPQALALVQVIGGIEAEGLLPQDYHHKRLLQMVSAQGQDYVDYDLLLSDAAANLSRHLLMGKVNPEGISPDWKAKPRQRDLVEVMEQLTRANDVESRLQQLRPQQVRYVRLLKLLGQLNEKTPGDWRALPRAPAIKPGANDARLPVIRARLQFWGDLATDELVANATYYDEILEAAVKHFQERHGLDVDGIIGAGTLDALNVTPATRRQQVINNLERWRWLADDFGERHVLVNIAGFELKVIDNNQTVMRKPVIVGRDYRRTPVFSDRIRYLVFNPTWTVPHKLAVKDKLPDIQADPSYLTRLGFTVFDQQQNRVDPMKVDWSKITERNFSYRLVQSPGPLNALGQVKFMFPNQYDVYLHDTPSRELFSKAGRAFSSGCVRVAEPLELAALLLEGNGMTRAQIDEIIAKGEQQTVFLKNPVPVHIEYWTAWIDSNNQLNFRNDIYERDPPLAAALAAPLYAH
jgi:murein L,D-transpeptidase YcbB/YkuD